MMPNQNTLKYALPGLMIAAFLLGFLPLLQKMAIRWDSGDNSYAYLIVPLFIYLCWEKKSAFKFAEFSWNIWGIIPVLASIALIFIGELGSVETLLYIGIWGCIVGVMAVLYGRRLLVLWFPLLILAFIVPLPPFVNRMLTFQLKLAASTLSVMMLRLADVSVLQDGNIIDLGITQLQVVDACSGLRYLMPLILMALLFGSFYCRRWWQNAILLVTVIPLSIFVNGLRIFLTGMLHVWGHPELAEDFFHDFSGWIVFVLAGGILLGISLVLRRFTVDGSRFTVLKDSTDSNIIAESSKKKDGKLTVDGSRLTVAKGSIDSKAANIDVDGDGGGRFKEKDGRLTVDGSRLTVNNDFTDSIKPETGNRKLETAGVQTPWRKPIAITVILCLIFAGSGYALQNLPTAANLPERASFDSFPMTIGEWQAKRDFLSQEILDSLWSDDYVSATYFHPDRRHAIHLLIPFYEYQGTRHTAHAPQSCMLGGGWALIGSRERTVTTADGTRFPIMTAIWEKAGTRVLGSYFFFQRGRTITSPWMNKYWLMVDAFTRQRTDGALVRAEMTLPPGQSIEEAYGVLEGFVGRVYSILPTYVPL